MSRELGRKNLDKYIEYKPKVDNTVSLLSAQINVIIKVICDTLNIKNYWWDWSYKEYLYPEVDEEYIKVHISKTVDDGYEIYNEGIPIKFLEYTDEQIIEYVMQNKQKHEEEEAAKKSKVNERRKNNKLKRESILAKLTEEERKILNLK